MKRFWILTILCLFGALAILGATDSKFQILGHPNWGFEFSGGRIFQFELATENQDLLSEAEGVIRKRLNMNLPNAQLLRSGPIFELSIPQKDLQGGSAPFTHTMLTPGKVFFAYRSTEIPNRDLISQALSTVQVKPSDYFFGFYIHATERIKALQGNPQIAFARDPNAASLDVGLTPVIFETPVSFSKAQSPVRSASSLIKAGQAGIQVRLDSQMLSELNKQLTKDGEVLFIVDGLVLHSLNVKAGAFPNEFSWSWTGRSQEQVRKEAADWAALIDSGSLAQLPVIRSQQGRSPLFGSLQIIIFLGIVAFAFIFAALTANRFDFSASFGNLFYAVAGLLGALGFLGLFSVPMGLLAILAVICLGLGAVLIPSELFRERSLKYTSKTLIATKWILPACCFLAALVIFMNTWPQTLALLFLSAGISYTIASSSLMGAK